MLPRAARVRAMNEADGAAGGGAWHRLSAASLSETASLVDSSSEGASLVDCGSEAASLVDCGSVLSMDETADGGGTADAWAALQACVDQHHVVLLPLSLIHI